MRLIIRTLLCLTVGMLLSAQSWAAFPSVVVNGRSTATNTVSPLVVTLPIGATSGNLVVVLLQARSNTTTWSQTAGTTGWTELYDANGQAFYYKQIGAAEANPSFDLSVSERSGASMLAITGHENPATQAPEASTGATGASTAPNPDSLTPTGGAKDYLWIAVDGNLGSSTVTVAPTNYTGLNAFDTGAGPNGASGATAERQLNAASEDPGAFTMGTSRTWYARTIAIHPTAARRRIMLVD